MRLLIACILILGLSGVSYAQDAGTDNPYFKKYGEEGVTRLLAFDKAINERPEALTSEKKDFPMPEIVKGKDSEGDTLASVPKHEACTRGVERAVAGSVLTETYKLEHGGKTHDVKITVDNCTERNIDLKTKKLSPDSEKSYTKFKLYVDGKQTLDLFFPGDIIDYGFYKSELIVDVIECCNADNYYNRYDWLAGKELEKDILHINGDDVPQNMLPRTEVDDTAIDNLLDTSKSQEMNAFGLESVDDQLKENRAKE